MKEITDPKLLEQLESKEVTDPVLLAQLNVGGEPTTSRLPTGFSMEEAKTRRKQELLGRMGTLEKGLVGVGAGMVGLARGAGQRLGLVSTQDIEEARRLEAPVMETTAGKIGKVVGEVAPFAALPLGAPAGIAARIGTAAISGGAMGFLQPTGEGESITQNVVTTGVTAAATAGFMGIGSKIFNAVKGPVVNQITQLSQKYGIRTTLGEIKNNPIIKKAEVLLEDIPLLGIKKFREKQQTDVARAGKDFLSQYVVNPSAATTQAMKEANDAFLDGLYATVRQSGTKLPSTSADETRRITTNLLNTYPDVFKSIQNTHVKRILQDIMEGLEKTTPEFRIKPQSIPGSKTVITTPAFKANPPLEGKQYWSPGIGTKTIQEPTTTGFQSPAQTFTHVTEGIFKPGYYIPGQKIPRLIDFEDLWVLRKGIGQEIGDATTDTAKGQFKLLYHAVSDDMDKMFSEAGGPAGNILRKANESWKQYSLKFDVIREAYDKAIGTIKGGEMDFFSAKKFATSLKNLANDPKYKRNIKWLPDEIDYMNGLAKIMEVTKRAGQFTENPPTGQRAILPILGGQTAAAVGYMASGTPGGAVVGGAILGGTALGKFLTTTKVGQRLVMAASKIEPTSPTMAKLIQKVYGLAPIVSASAGQDMIRTSSENVGTIP